MKTKQNISNKIIIDVYELVNYIPVLKYNICVVDKMILTVSNDNIPQKGVYKTINEPVKERLELFELSDVEKIDYSGLLNCKIAVRKISNKYLYLNLTDNDLISLGFMKKPPIIKFKLNENKRWIIGLIVMGAIGIAAIIFNNSKESKTSDIKDTNQIRQEEKIKPSAKQSEFSQSDSLTVSVDSTDISKTEKLHEK